METLDKHAPKKTKINETLRKVIMKRSQFRNKANKTKDPKDILKHKKQRNYVVKLNSQSKQENFDSLNPFLDSKLFGRAVSRTFPTSTHFVTQKLS